MLADRIRMSSYKSACSEKLIDRSNPTLVVNKDYSTSGNGGRKLVRLKNGWLVAGAVEGNTIKLFRSKDNGETWSLIGNVSSTKDPSFSLVSYNNTIYVLSKRYNGNFFVAIASVDVTTLSDNNSTFLPLLEIEYKQKDKDIDTCSLSINSQGTELHACWSSKNETYLNSFNIRYCKGSINADGSVIWGNVEQVSIINDSGVDGYKNPSIIVIGDNPIIIHNYDSPSTDQCGIGGFRFDGTMWRMISGSIIGIYYGGSNKQSSPSACVDKDGVIHVSWQGAKNSSEQQIFYSQSIDGGNTWSTTREISSGEDTKKYNPSITVNKNGQVFISFHSTLGVQIRRQASNGNWAAIFNLYGNNQQHPSTLINNTLDFEFPLMIYESNDGIQFVGKWYQNNIVVKSTDPIGAVGPQKLIAGDLEAGYFGTVNGLITNSTLSNVMNITAGTLLDPENTDITFHKFIHKGRILLIPSKVIRCNISWENIQTQNCVKGKVLHVGSDRYLCRLMTGSRHYYTDHPSIAGGEWDDLFVRFHVSNGGLLTDEDLGIGQATICQEISSMGIDKRIVRGANSVTYFGTNMDYNDNYSSLSNWRPVLEVL